MKNPYGAMEIAYRKLKKQEICSSVEAAGFQIHLQRLHIDHQSEPMGHLSLACCKPVTLI